MIKILAIDDQKDNLIIIKAVISNNIPNCLVLTALSGQEGIEIAKRENPDTILLDIIMPDMDGYETCKILKESELTQHIPVIMITAIRTDSESRTKGLNLGADAFLSKPIDSIEFTAQVNVMLRIKEAEDQLRQEKVVLEELVKERTFELAESEKKYKALYEFAPLPYQSLNEDGSFKDVNPAWLNTLGYTREEVIGKNYADFLPPIYKKHFEKNFPVFKKQGYINDVQFKIIHKNGSLIDISLQGRISYHPNGNFKHSYCVFQDITEKILATENLKKSEERFSQVSENLQEWIWEVDKQGLYTYSSENIYDLIGYTKDEIIGKKHFYDLFLADDKESIKKVAFDAFENHQSFKNLINCNISKNGDPVWLSSSGVPILDEQNKLKGYRGADINISQRVLAEKENKKLSTAVDQSPSVIVITNLEGVIEYVNPKFTQLTGFTLEEAKGSYTNILKAGEFENDVYHELWKTITAGNEWHGIFHNKKKNGELFWESAAISPIFDQNGKISNYLKVAEDITEKKLAEEELQRSENKFKSLMQQSPFVVEIYNLDGLQISVNKAYEELWGFPAEHTVNKFNVLQSKEVKNTGLIDYINRAYNGESVRVPEYSFDSSGKTEADGPGRNRWLSTNIYPLKGAA
ncbi:MAG: PAS domain S-box protein, partial [Bacteroidales bacterium]|nr:PAS domain S-box protein [Bacteroidales bacterium]